MRRHHIVFALAAASAAAWVLVACGARAAEEPPPDRAASLPATEALAEAASRTATAGSFRFDYVLSAGQDEVRAQGLFDPASRRGRLSFESSSALLSADERPGEGRWEVVSDGDVAYLRSPLDSGLGGGRPWLRIDARRLAGSAGLDAASWRRLTGGGDPAGAALLLWGAEEARRVGTEAVRGVATTRYAALLDPRRAAEAAPPERREEAAVAAARLPGAVPAVVWVDAEGRLRRLRYAAVDVGLPAGPVAATYDFYDFGVDVDVRLPPPEEITDLASAGVAD